MKTAISRLFLLLAAATLLVAPIQATATTYGDVYGVWRNPKNTVHVEIKPCGARVCGYVVWANAKAQADAREGGTPNLIGSQLLREFAPDSKGGWKGKVFVPNRNMTLSGTAKPINASSLVARGCLLPGILCKSQVWTRVAA
ncbi:MULTISPECIES: DUF2147 domain-containing protein [Phenylobacterium]|uniref:Uncharacterized protein (DUF2147 family) n=1 Tax=Phenylobacterium koreense TaxID=266125 RepID=A0ABV2EDR5_9CAUL